MRIAVSVESTSDLSKELLAEKDVKVIPFHITLGDKTFKDGEVTTLDMFKYVDETGTLPKTNALNEFEYTEYFAQLRTEYDAVVHICLSSGLSSSCSNAERASTNVPDVFVVDSLSLSTGIGLLALYARRLADEGVAPKEIAKKLVERRANLQVSFVVERLDYLYKGGRCSSLARFGANLLKLRPRIVVKDGKMSSDKKYRGGMGGVIAKYGESLMEEFNNPDLSVAFITYTSATEEMLVAAEEACKNFGFEKVYRTTAGGTIASHCGANTLGILYFNDGGVQ